MELELPSRWKETRSSSLLPPRDPSAPEDLGRYDDWSKIYVEEKDLAAWLEKKIEGEINAF